MKFNRVLSALFVISSFAGSAHSQDEWKPSNFGFLARTVGAAKAYTNKDGVVVLGLIFNQGKTEYRVEERTKLVDGKEVTYTVQVPVIVSNDSRIEVPFADVQIWTVGGRQLKAKEAEKALSTTRRCLVTTSKYYKGNAFMAEMFKDDVCVVWYDRKKAKVLPMKKPDEAAEKK